MGGRGARGDQDHGERRRISLLVVFGSINLDLAFRTARLPAAGETVLGPGYLISPGGKGANQAHAARLFGAETRLFGAVGNDAFAAPALAQLETAGVDLSGVQRLAAQTGCAAVSVDEEGQNQIIVAPGANLEARQSIITDDVLARTRAVLLQMEVNPRENWTLIERAKRHGCRTILSNAPAGPIPTPILRALDVLIVNESELAGTADAAGLPIDPVDALRALSGQFAMTVILTMGEHGAVSGVNGELARYSAAKVTAIDTTAAGDTFAGVLGAALIEDRSLPDAIAFATVAAGLACTKPGAQIAQPSRREIDAAMPAYLADAAGTNA